MSHCSDRGDVALILSIVMVSAADLWAQQGGCFFGLRRPLVRLSSLTDSDRFPVFRTCDRGILLPA